MSEGKRLVKNTGILAIGGMSTKLVQFFMLPLYTAVLSTEEFGTVDYLNIIAFFCIPIVTLLMDEALFRFLIDCESEEERARVITCASAVSLAGCIIFLLIVSLISLFVGVKNIVWVTSLVLAGSSFTMVSALLRGFGDVKGYTLASFLSTTATVALNVLFIVAFRWGVDGMLAATILSQGAVAVAFASYKKVWRFFNPRNFDSTCSKRLVVYSLPLIPNKVSWTIMNMSSRLIVMNQLGAGAAGILAISYKFPNVMSQAYDFFYLSWKESSARALKSDEDEGVFYNQVYRHLKRFMIGMVMVMTALTPFIFEIMIDESYASGTLYVPILMLSTYFSNISGFYGGIFTAHFETRIMGTTTIASAAICLVLNVLLIPLMGLYGATLASLVSLFVVNEYRRIKVGKHVRLRADVPEKAITIVCLAAVILLYYTGLFAGVTIANLAAVALSLFYFFAANRTILGGALKAVRSKVSKG